MLTTCTLAASKVSALPQCRASLPCFSRSLPRQPVLSFAEIQNSCGLADISMAEHLCVDCMQASLLFGKIDQCVSHEAPLLPANFASIFRLKKCVTIESVAARDPSDAHLRVSCAWCPLQNVCHVLCLTHGSVHS
jgi:hypothetical protein